MRLMGPVVEADLLCRLQRVEAARAVIAVGKILVAFLAALEAGLLAVRAQLVGALPALHAEVVGVAVLTLVTLVAKQVTALDRL